MSSSSSDTEHTVMPRSKLTKAAVNLGFPAVEPRGTLGEASGHWRLARGSHAGQPRLRGRD